MTKSAIWTTPKSSSRVLNKDYINPTFLPDTTKAPNKYKPAHLILLHHLSSVSLSVLLPPFILIFPPILPPGQSKQLGNHRPDFPTTIAANMRSLLLKPNKWSRNYLTGGVALDPFAQTLPVAKAMWFTRSLPLTPLYITNSYLSLPLS